MHRVQSMAEPDISTRWQQLQEINRWSWDRLKPKARVTPLTVDVADTLIRSLQMDEPPNVSSAIVITESNFVISSKDVCLTALSILKTVLDADEQNIAGKCVVMLPTKELITLTVALLDNPCELVRYSASRTLASMVHHRWNEGGKVCIQHFNLANGQSEQRLLTGMHFFKELLSIKLSPQDSKEHKLYNQDLQSILISKLSSSWGQFVEESSWDDTLRFTFLCLWVKIVKLNLDPSLDDGIRSTGDQLSELKSNAVSLVGKCHLFSATPYLYNKMLSVLQHSLSSELLCATVVRNTRKLLENAPMPSTSYCFGGVSQSSIVAAVSDFTRTACDEPLMQQVKYTRKAVSVVLKAMVNLCLPMAVTGACSMTKLNPSMSVSKEDSDLQVSLRQMQGALVIVEQHLKLILPHSDDIHWCIKLYGDQDAQLIEAMFSLQTIYSYCISPTKEALPPEFSSPHQIFVNFLQHVCFEHSVLLDLLLSSETSFLQYLVKYLKLAQSDWHSLVLACHNIGLSEKESSEIDLGDDSDVQSSECLSSPAAQENCLVEYSDSGGSLSSEGEMESESTQDALGEGDCEMNIICDAAHSSTTCGDAKEEGVNVKSPATLDRMMATLIRLRFAIERLAQKKLFPYDPSPLLKLLIKCEDLYEK